MRAIRISDKVWQAIAQRGKFGETEEDVLRRVFSLPSQNAVSTEDIMPQNLVAQQPEAHSTAASKGRQGRGGRRYSTVRISSLVHGRTLSVNVEGGYSKDFPLPEEVDKVAIRKVRDEAFAFAREHGATQGQLDAITKALNAGGYYIVGPRQRGPR
jgi:hypothetical protein